MTSAVLTSPAAWIFVLSIAQLCYTFAGYPLLLLLWSRAMGKSIIKADINPTVAIVVVVHNGEALIEKKIATCVAQQYPADRLRLLIVSDGSSDATCAIVERYEDQRVQLMSFPERRGKAACLNDAVAACAEEIIVFTDLRQRLDALSIRHLVNNFADPAIGVASGQLVFEQEGMTNFGESMDAYWRYEKFLRRAESNIHSCVGVTGAIYALRRECFQPIPGDTLLDDVLIPMNSVLRGRRVVFERDALAYDQPSRELAQERVRKIRTLAGNFQLICRYPALLLPWRNPIAWQFVSHKVMRLLAPLALAGALLGNLLLVGKGAFFIATFAAQLFCYLFAAIGMALPSMDKIRLIRFASAFLSLNWFVVLGFREFLTNREAHLWKNNQAATKSAGSST
jgi:poly-beta-1,6-N-acetyl-D-glucosamine synthase